MSARPGPAAAGITAVTSSRAYAFLGSNGPLGGAPAFPNFAPAPVPYQNDYESKIAAAITQQQLFALTTAAGITGLRGGSLEAALQLAPGTLPAIPLLPAIPQLPAPALGMTLNDGINDPTINNNRVFGILQPDLTRTIGSTSLQLSPLPKKHENTAEIVFSPAGNTRLTEQAGNPKNGYPGAPGSGTYIILAQAAYSFTGMLDQIRNDRLTMSATITTNNRGLSSYDLQAGFSMDVLGPNGVFLGHLGGISVDKPGSMNGPGAIPDSASSMSNIQAFNAGNNVDTLVLTSYERLSADPTSINAYLSIGSVPEPASLLMLGTGLLMVAWLSRGRGRARRLLKEGVPGEAGVAPSGAR
jgi:hypothetical protein